MQRLARPERDPRWRQSDVLHRPRRHLLAGIPGLVDRCGRPVRDRPHGERTGDRHPRDRRGIRPSRSCSSSRRTSVLPARLGRRERGRVREDPLSSATVCSATRAERPRLLGEHHERAARPELREAGVLAAGVYTPFAQCAAAARAPSGTTSEFEVQLGAPEPGIALLLGAISLPLGVASSPRVTVSGGAVRAAEVSEGRTAPATCTERRAGERMEMAPPPSATAPTTELYARPCVLPRPAPEAHEQPDRARDVVEDQRQPRPRSGRQLADLARPGRRAARGTPSCRRRRRRAASRCRRRRGRRRQREVELQAGLREREAEHEGAERGDGRPRRTVKSRGERLARERADRAQHHGGREREPRRAPARALGARAVAGAERLADQRRHGLRVAGARDPREGRACGRRSV